MYTRRQFSKLALASIPATAAFARIDSRVHGVQIGVQSYSFRDRPLDDAIKAMVEIGLGECELYAGHVEPKMKRDELRKWRTTVSMDHFHDIRKKFDDAGIQLYAYNYSFRDDYTDEEIARGFEMAKALGVGIITASSTLSVVDRVDREAQKAKIKVGFHGHSDTKHPNEFSSPESFEKAMAGRSPYIDINLDIGHFFAAGFDPVDFLNKHHERIVTLHIKDRKKNQGENMPFGEGDTPIKPVLHLLETKKYRIPANIEYEYKGGDTVVEVKKCFEYCKQALA
ncbi:MAG TPA: sugar phosphate isomerase/epimerase [Bryobacteraceae bacterium]|nr:sugar phosphate isomerase/epimerase [Bryobacteraceae bacterium]